MTRKNVIQWTFRFAAMAVLSYLGCVIMGNHLGSQIALLIALLFLFVNTTLIFMIARNTIFYGSELVAIVIIGVATALQFTHHVGKVISIFISIGAVILIITRANFDKFIGKT